MASPEPDSFSLPETAAIGRTALRVGSLDSLLPFYRDALGFAVQREGDRAWLAAAGDRLVRLDEAPEAADRTRAQAGLFHVAIRVPDRPALANALARIRSAGASLTGASDHDVSEALYLRDPEGNGIEVYRDRPESAWEEQAGGHVKMGTRALDLDALAAVGDDDPGADLPAGTDIGHVHLEVTDLDDAESFYADALGMNVRARYGEEATFLAAGDYHHHVGLNVWNDRTEPAGEGRGLAWFEVVVPDDATVETLRERFVSRDYTVEARDTGLEVQDTDGIRVRVRTV